MSGVASSSSSLGALNSHMMDAFAGRATRGEGTFARLLSSADEAIVRPLHIVGEAAVPLLRDGGGAAFVPLKSPVDSMKTLDMDANDEAKSIAIESEPVPLRAANSSDADEVRKSAEQLVASALLLPLLEQLNQSPLRPTDGPFAQSLGEKRFGPLLHQHLADRMMQSRNFGLVDAVVARMGGRGMEVTA